MEAISGPRQPRSTQGNSLLNCVLRCPLLVPISCGDNFWCMLNTGNSLLYCVLRCPLAGPISCGGHFWCSSPAVNTRQFFSKVCTKMSTFGANPVWRQFLVLVNHDQHKAILTKLCTKMSTFRANLVWRQFLVLVNRSQHKAILY